MIRVNSQSGKGGIAYLLHTEYGIDLPRRLQIDFAKYVQARAADTGVEITAALEEAGYPIEVLGLTQQSIGSGNDSVALMYVEYRGDTRNGWACGRSDSVLAASLSAVVRAAGDAARR